MAKTIAVWRMSSCIRDVALLFHDSAINKRQNKEPASKMNKQNWLSRCSPVAEEGRKLWNEGPPAPIARLGWPPPTVSGRTGCSRTRTLMMRLSSQKRLNWKCRANPKKPQVYDVIHIAWIWRRINETINVCAKIICMFETRIRCETNSVLSLVGYYPVLSC